MSVYDRIKERSKEYNFTQEEIDILNRAKSKFSMHMRIGSLAGLVVGGAIAKVQKIRTFGTIWLCFGTTLFGSQAGMVTGSIASINMIKSSPNSQRIMEFINEMQLSFCLEYNYLKRHLILLQHLPPRRTLHPPDQPTNSDGYRFENGNQSTLADEFEKENKPQHSFHQGPYDNSGNSTIMTDEMVRDINANESDYNYGHPQKPLHKSSQDNYWNKIRTQNTTSTTWDKIRSNAKLEQQKQINDDNSRQQKFASKTDVDGDRYSMGLPRTREEFDEYRRGGKIKTNQFGDTEIRYDE
ncbi:5374_t:CDS:2 [Cetraspora pellucida]|uniref:5374_t:CDS:1 n=1 Tax=Cetraspora pellucida TaxID=1433469 RepID=A0A9N9HP88_9GLOM|nr:5374_t:CDS:2 [Cetraspora pellucida]